MKAPSLFLHLWPYLIAAWLGFASPADVCAQSAPVAAETAVQPAAPSAQKPPALSAPDAQRLLQGRRMLAAGVGLIVGGAAGIGIGLPKRDCHGEEDSQRLVAPLVAGAVVGGAGVAFTFGGGVRIAAFPLEYRNKHPPPPGIAMLGLGLAAGTALMMFLTSLPYVSCGAT